ncbi:peptide/nickel transport system substrate-binding protein [Defluviimonas denitrificans]|jgi:peptide/nickel transport system substrate-binding protein|uniref:Peptide/nickel transport system substrate-binding protein n=2 Tax=Albidovulum denitrificans TaxID=404881 RepID=A0A2S8SCD5_9RHOB|nr:peptide/nickel transport system substrate-binding protein [Defluviimonas denitrificans]
MDMSSVARMKTIPLGLSRIVATAMILTLAALPLRAAPQHGIAMYGKPALPPDFVSLPYVNPDAPKGGRIVMGVGGSFNSLNPYIVTGTPVEGLSLYTFETLMARSIDEPFSLYGLLAESVDTDESHTWVEYTLRPQAKFSDGSPVTVEDVMWSYETLGTKGHPRYRGAWSRVAKMEQTGPRSIRFTFTEPDRELALLMGMRPILKKADWAGKDFEKSSLDLHIGSGPYTVGKVEPGRYISFRRDPDYWGKDLAINRGRFNFDEIRYDYFADENGLFQAFTAGLTNSYREPNAARWQNGFDIPAIASGAVVKSEIPHSRPSGMIGFVMNLRNPIFDDWRVREALIDAFNFEFVNMTLNGGTEPRITSYFSNSVLGMDHGPATGRVADLLAPFAADLPPGTIEGYSLPVGSAERSLDRKNLKTAVGLLADAGWTVQDGVLKNAAGEPFAFEILLAAGSTEAQSIIDIYVEALKRLGISPTVTVADTAQFKERTDRYAFDMTYIWRALSLSPGNEQYLYWGSEVADLPGARNWAGIKSPAVDSLIGAMLNSANTDDFIAATQALDRVLTAGRTVIPLWFSKTSKIAHSANLHYPERIPLYGDWPGFQPEVWWYED